MIFELKSIAELERVAKEMEQPIRDLALREIAKRENGYRREKYLRRLTPKDYGISTLP